MIVDIDTVKEYEESERYMESVLIGLFKKYTEGYKVVEAEGNSNVPTTPYITLNINNRSWVGDDTRNTPIQITTDPTTGLQTSVFENTYTVLVKFHKGNAFTKANMFVQALSSDAVWYDTFGSADHVGLLGYSGVRKENTPIDQQAWEKGAVFSLQVSTLSKSDYNVGVIADVGYISEVKGGVTVKTGDRELHETFHVRPNYDDFI